VTAEAQVDFRDDEQVTRALDEVYAEEDSSLDPLWVIAQFRALPVEEW
jgi:hypothetical protein